MNKQYMLTYELKDDPDVEHEVECASFAEALAHLQGCSDMLVWAELTDSMGNVLADTENFI